MLNNLVGGILGKVVDNAEGILDKVITTDKERDAAKFEIKKFSLRIIQYENSIAHYIHFLKY